jgi:hypothetical protein
MGKPQFCALNCLESKEKIEIKALTKESSFSKEYDDAVIKKKWKSGEK